MNKKHYQYGLIENQKMYVHSGQYNKYKIKMFAFLFTSAYFNIAFAFALAFYSQCDYIVLLYHYVYYNMCECILCI